MIDQFAQFQYTHLFLRERFRAGLLDTEGFRYRLSLLGFTCSEINSEIRETLEEENRNEPIDYFIL